MKSHEIIQQKFGRRNKEYAILGDFDGKVVVPGYNFLNYARVNDVVQLVWNRICDAKPGIEVEIEYQGSQIVVVGLRGRAYPVTDDLALNQAHADTHLEGARDPVYIWMSQILNLRIVPTGFTVQIWQGRQYADVWRAPARSANWNMATYQPVSGAVWVLIYLTRSGSFAAIEGETVDTVALLTPAMIPALPFGGWALAAIRLYATQTAIDSIKDIYDLRWAAMPYNAACGSSSETISGGVITAHSQIIAVAGEGGADDDLVTINGGAHGAVIALLAPDGSANPVTIKTTGNISLAEDYVLDDPAKVLALIYDDDQDAWLQFCGGGGGSGATTLSGLSDVDIDTPADGDVLLYDSGSSKWVNGGTSLVIWDESTTTQGQDRDRTTSNSYASHSVLINLFRPLDLYQVLWDIGATGTYTLSLQWPDGTEIADLGDQVVSSVPAADVTWTASPRIKLMPGEYLLVLTPESNKAFDDNNTNCPVFYSYYYQREVYYGTSSSTSYSAAVKLVGYLGEYNV